MSTQTAGDNVNELLMEGGNGESEATSPPPTSPPSPPPPSHFSYNVILTLIVVGLTGCADSLWAGTTLVSYLYIETNDSNSKVGYVEAASGLATLLTALPVGYIADKHGRSKACAIGGVALLVANGITTWAVATDKSYYYLLAAMCMWGIGSGVVSGPVQALYADSIPVGERSKFYVYLFATYLLVGTIGPALSICIFEFDKYNDWTLKELRLVIYVGMVLELIISILLFFFDDSKALGKEADQVFAMDDRRSDASRRSESIDGGGGGLEGGGKQPSNPLHDDDAAVTLRQGLLANGSDIEGHDDEDHTGKASSTENGGGDDRDGDDMAGLSPDEQRALKRRTALIPRLTFAAGLVTALGSGMTVKFFPLFFKNDCKMSPSGVQGIYLAVPVLMAIFCSIAQKVASLGFCSCSCGGRGAKGAGGGEEDAEAGAAAALVVDDADARGKRDSFGDDAGSSTDTIVAFGRVQTIMLCKFTGVCMLFLMVYLTQHRGTAIVMVPIYLFRTGMMNSTYPLEESISMDFVPKDQRARWKSLESIAQFGWCGSAALGGWLADRYDYSTTFLFTALIQGSSLIIWGFLIPLVPRTEKRSKKEN